MLEQIRESLARKRSENDKWVFFSVAAVLALGAFVLTYQFVEPAPPSQLRMATGKAEGAYHAHGLQYQAALKQHGIELELVPTEGSIENLQKLHDERGKAVDIAFLQTGIGRGDSHAITSLGALYYEPLWFFSKRGSSPESLNDLRGKTVAAGSLGSGTLPVVTTLLNSHGMSDNISLLNVGGQAALDAVIDGEADGLFTVAAPTSPWIQRLLARPNVEPLSFRHAEAYAKQHAFLVPVTLHEGSVSLAKTLPNGDLSLVAPVAALVANEHLHPALASLLAQVAQSLHGSGDLLSNPGDFPGVQGLDYPMHSDAERVLEQGPPWLQRHLPFWLATLIDRLKVMLLPLVALILPLSKILPPTYRWRMRRRIYQWYDEVELIDQAAHEDDSGYTAIECLQALDEIEQELRRVEVPLSYHSELYSLRLHVDLLKRQLAELT